MIDRGYIIKHKTAEKYIARLLIQSQSWMKDIVIGIIADFPSLLADRTQAEEALSMGAQVPTDWEIIPVIITKA